MSSHEDDRFEILFPPESRYENRIVPEHTRSQWKFRLAAYHQRCAYCGIHARDTPEGYLTRDHVQPVRRNGSDKIENIVPACWRCNSRKGNHAPGEITTSGWLVPEPRPRKRRVRV